MYIMMLSDTKTFDIRTPATFHDEKQALEAFSTAFKTHLKMAGGVPGEDDLPAFGRPIDNWEGKNSALAASYNPMQFVIRRLAGDDADVTTFASLKLLPMVKKEDRIILALSLVRFRFETMTPELMGTDNYYIPITEEERAYINQPKDGETDWVKNLLIKKIQKELQSAKGWRDVVQSCMDYNWGDAVMTCFDSAVGAISEQEAAQSPVVSYALMVSQDELLAPETAAVTWECFCGDSEAPVLVDLNATLDMRDGTLSLTDDIQAKAFDLLDEKKVTSARITFINGDTIPCDPEEEFLQPYKKTK